jgi:uncharacterized protein (DUF2384 family)
MATAAKPISHTGGSSPSPTGPGLSAADLLDLAHRVFGTQKAADFWMDRPNPELAGETPNGLVATGRAQIVKDFLEGILTGNYG